MDAPLLPQKATFDPASGGQGFCPPELAEDAAQVPGAAIPWHWYLLVLLVVPMWSGALPIIGEYFGLGLRGLWLAFCLLLFLIARTLPLHRLLYPMWPYLAWLFAYLVLGLLVSPNRTLPLALTIGFYTLVFSAFISIVTSQPSMLKLFANSAQWVLLINVAFLVLVVYHPDLQSISAPDPMASEVYDVAKERFAGLWGNPNMAGYVCIISMLLSVWATPWLAWLGRFSGVAIIYFSASRKASVLLVLILLLNMVIVQRRNVKAWVLLGVGALAVMLMLVFGDRLMGRSVSHLASDRKISRIIDFSEKDTEGGTRVDLLKTWLPIAARAPWYGYGLGAMGGSQPRSRTPRKELDETGTHNTYLGIWVDVGPFGLLAFLFVFLRYIYQCITSRFTPRVRWALLSLMICNVLILTVSHSHLFCAEGIIAFALFFLLPTSPALQASRLGSRVYE